MTNKAGTLKARNAGRERLGEPAPMSLHGVPVARVWLGQAELVFRASAVSHADTGLTQAGRATGEARAS